VTGSLAVNEEDTIAAAASPPGGAYRGIVRISGPEVVRCLRTCFRDDAGGSPAWEAVRQARVFRGSIQLEPPLGELPCDVYFWPGPRSFTRQTVAEIHTPGSPPARAWLVQANSRSVPSWPGGSI